MLSLIALTSCATIVLVVLAIAQRPPNPARVRARALGIEPDMPALAGDQSFANRVLRPMANALLRSLPHRWLRRLDAMLVAAGEPLDLGLFVLLWTGSGVGLPLLGLLRMGPRGAVLFGVLGICGPFWLLRRRVRRRQRAIGNALPDAIDLLVTCVEAGLGLDAALVRVAEATEGPLSDEITRTVREMAVGRSRHEALLELGSRSGVRDLDGFIRPIVQAERSGVSIGTALRVQAEDLRVRRRQRAEEAARKIPVKMVAVTGVFFIPAILVVILAAAATSLMDALKGIG